MLLASAATPPAALFGAALWESSLTDWLSAHSLTVNFVACFAAIAVVIAFERPRSWSPLAYARQLRARFVELQSTYDADSRRRPEGKEKEDDLEVPPEP